ncbi:4,5-DOPA dioxygenase extradiol [Luteibacter rhizovicinus]|uniref:4,5-DOPA dioxygenase extradiol n=1 Tax=Luteibacter rhizovicinus TaxID=242606 RepID=A0A4R3YP55_9GAMM|nr:class III extradiol ring-cleavage dioxygenase [Luteibacter rhizovicinus]TCV93338.1 4,5-DOPA dioxygenase extradiol [Luteibacter rhizovicinus]
MNDHVPTPRQPVLFISHGSPTFAVEPGELGPRLRETGASLENVRAVLVVSPHWQTDGVRVTTSERPPTIHDFGGFPEALYRLRYDVAGAPDVAAEAASLLTDAGFRVTPDAVRGLDHGAWVPMSHLLPDATIPVIQVSMPHDLDTASALAFGRALAPLRDRGVLIVGSGSLTHNLYEVRRTTDEAPYAQRFATWNRDAIGARDIEALVDYRRRAPEASRAHPTEEHYLPLLVALGASDASDPAFLIEGGMTYGVLSMDSYAWGFGDAQAGHMTRLA